MQMTALRLAAILTDAGVTCAIVGGAVRDAVFGGTVKDFDIVVFSQQEMAALEEFLERHYNTFCSDSLGTDTTSATAGDDDGFTARWLDWRKLVGEDSKDYHEITFDLLLTAPDSLHPDPHSSFRTAIDAITDVQKVLAAFDVSMNQQALVIFGGNVYPIIKPAPYCTQLKPLSLDRETRMRKKADVLGLRYVGYTPPIAAPYADPGYL